MYLSWHNVGYFLANKTDVAERRILQEVTGEAHPGEVVAIMGGPGAGQALLLNLLAGRAVPPGMAKGKISVNGHRRDSNWRRLSVCVEQDDCLFPKLTVRETIMFAAMMKLPKASYAEEAARKTNAIMRELGLAHVADAVIGESSRRGITKSQRKRVSIAVALVADPQFLFLHEPTLGLDAQAALNLLSVIKEMAMAECRTVVLTINRPRHEIVELFSKILLLAQGEMVFFGNINDAILHFEKIGLAAPLDQNPADHFIEQITMDSAAWKRENANVEDTMQKSISAWKSVTCNLANRRDPVQFASSRCTISSGLNDAFITEIAVDEARNSTMPFSPKWPRSKVDETWLLLHREYCIIKRSPGILLIRLAENLIISLLLSFAGFQVDNTSVGMSNRLGVIFLLIARTVSMCAGYTAHSQVHDKDVVQRDRSNAMYRVLPYLIAKFVSLVPIQSVISTISAFLIYYITGLRVDGFQHFVAYLAILVMTFLCAISLGLLIAAVSADKMTMVVLLSLHANAAYIMGGNMASSPSVTWIIRWVRYFSLPYYAYDAMAYNEFAGNSFDGVSGDAYLEEYGLNQIHLEYFMIATSAYLTITFLLAYLILKRSTRPNAAVV